MSTGYRPAVITQDKSISVTLGAIVKIPCSIDNDWVLTWYQQKPGDGPKFLLVIENQRASGLPSRFTSSGTEAPPSIYTSTECWQKTRQCITVVDISVINGLVPYTKTYHSTKVDYKRLHAASERILCCFGLS